MNHDRIAMSQRDRDTLTALKPVLAGQRTQAEAARLLGKSTRQVRRLVARLRDEGDAGLIHRLRDRPSNRQIDNNNKTQHPLVLRGAPPGLRAHPRRRGPRRARPERRRRDPPTLARRRGALAADRPARRPSQPPAAAGLLRRARPARRLGARLDRGPRPGHGPAGDDRRRHRPHPGPLRPGRDDRRLLRPAGTLAACPRPPRRPLQRQEVHLPRHRGRRRRGPPPDAVRPGLRRAGHRADLGAQPAGQGARRAALRHRPGPLGQADAAGRRRVAGAGQRPGSAASLQPQFNRRFTVAAADGSDAHRPWDRRAHDLRAILCHQEPRTVSNDYVVRYGGRLFQLARPALPGLRGGVVVVEARRDGTLAIRFKDAYLRYTEIAASAAGPAAGAAPGRSPVPASRTGPRRTTPGGSRSGPSRTDEQRTFLSGTDRTFL